MTGSLSLLPPGKSGLFCMGSALVDYEFKVTLTQLKQIGITKGQMTLADDAKFEASFNFLVDKFDYYREGGGSAINSLVTYCRLGGAGGLPCVVGEDDSGRFLLDEFAKIGIRTYPFASKAQLATGRCLAMITPDKDRTMLTNLGINQELGAIDEPQKQALQRKLAKHGVFYAEAYLLATPTPCNFLLESLEVARVAGLFVALSMSDVSMVEHCRDQLAQALSGRVDLLFGNHSEYARYTGEKVPAKIFAALPSGIKAMALTCGAEGAYLCVRDEAGILPEPRFVPATKVVAEDTLGAGDTYAGAFLFGLGEAGLSYTAAAEFAASAAAVVVSRMGPRLSQPECDKLKKGLAELVG